MKFPQAITSVLALWVYSSMSAPAPIEKDMLDEIVGTATTVTRFDFWYAHGGVLAHANTPASIAYRKIEANAPATCGNKYFSISDCRADCTPMADTCGYCVFKSCGFGADQYECICGQKPNAQCEFYIEPPMIGGGSSGGVRR